MPKGHPKKEITTVSFSFDEANILAKRLGYKTRQNLIDDLAMSLIPPTADPIAPLPVNPEVEGTGRSAEVAQPRSASVLSVGEKVSWSDEVDAAEAVKSKSDPAIEKLGEITTKSGDTSTSHANAMAIEALVEKVAAHSIGAADLKDGGKPKPWTEILKSNQSIGNPITLESVQPTEEIKISEDEWEEGVQSWKFPVILMVAIAKPSYMEMLRWSTVNWAKLNPKMSQIKPGVFLVEFQSEEERMEVLCKNWTFYHKSDVVLKPWDPAKGFDQQGLDSTPVWVRLPCLPSCLWTSRSLSKIVGRIGKPLAIDRFTAQRTRLDFARVLVEVNAQAVHLEEITINGPRGTRIKQSIMYECDLKKCTKCGRIGHEEANCRAKQTNKRPGKHGKKPVDDTNDTNVSIVLEK